MFSYLQIKVDNMQMEKQNLTYDNAMWVNFQRLLCYRKTRNKGCIDAYCMSVSQRYLESIEILIFRVYCL